MEKNNEEEATEYAEHFLQENEGSQRKCLEQSAQEMQSLLTDNFCFHVSVSPVKKNKNF